MHNGLLATLRNRLRNIASVELASVLSLLQDVATNNAPDDRFLTHGSSFSSRKAYSLLSSDHEIDLNAGYIWSFKAPIKVRIFGWLLCHDWLSTMANLHHKTITSHPDCPRCTTSHEDALHISILCPYALQVWALLGLQPPHSIHRIWETTTPVDLDINIWPTVALVILWKLWDSRNALVFRNELHTPQITLRNIVSDFTLWVLRFKDSVSREAAMSWRLYLTSRCNLLPPFLNIRPFRDCTINYIRMYIDIF
ncbi:hypothetical protein ZWY2020_056728 [Hordeum vulgare]|nr:hypothetical protein ZWY2020_056728 [Hordeum vulgare]